jgi:hypothetical protein
MVLPFLGYFFNEPTKSSLIGEKSPNLVTLVPQPCPIFENKSRAYLNEASLN